MKIQWILNILQWSYDHINVFFYYESESELKIDLSLIMRELLINFIFPQPLPPSVHQSTLQSRIYFCSNTNSISEALSCSATLLKLTPTFIQTKKQNRILGSYPEFLPNNNFAYRQIPVCLSPNNTIPILKIYYYLRYLRSKFAVYSKLVF